MSERVDKLCKACGRRRGEHPVNGCEGIYYATSPRRASMSLEDDEVRGLEEIVSGLLRGKDMRHWARGRGDLLGKLQRRVQHSKETITRQVAERDRQKGKD